MQNDTHTSNKQAHVTYIIYIPAYMHIYYIHTYIPKRRGHQCVLFGLGFGIYARALTCGVRASEMVGKTKTYTDMQADVQACKITYPSIYIHKTAQHPHACIRWCNLQFQSVQIYCPSLKAGGSTDNLVTTL